MEEEPSRVQSARYPRGGLLGRAIIPGNYGSILRYWPGHVAYTSSSVPRNVHKKTGTNVFIVLLPSAANRRLDGGTS